MSRSVRLDAPIKMIPQSVEEWATISRIGPNQLSAVILIQHVYTIWIDDE
jgi:hypothetical protein